jgi:retron-type reverse transcriptase
MVDFMFPEIDKGKVCIMVTIDLRKAFDKVDRTVLIHKLSWYGIDYRLIESLLKDRSQYVSLRFGCDEKISTTKETILGVPQGSCLSCVLFSLMINDICCCIRNSLPVLYADDDTIITSSYPEEIDKATVLLEDDIDRVLNSRQVLNDD